MMIMILMLVMVILIVVVVMMIMVMMMKRRMMMEVRDIFVAAPHMMLDNIFGPRFGPKYQNPCVTSCI